MKTEMNNLAQYKEGDLVETPLGVHLLRYIKGDELHSYAFMPLVGEYIFFRDQQSFSRASNIRGYASEEQKQDFINGLKVSEDEEKANEYLKRFFAEFN